MRIKFDAETAPPCSFGRHERRSAPRKSIKHNVAAFRAVHDGIGHQGQRLDRRMHGEIRIPFYAERVHAGIGPNIASVAAEATQFDIVNMRCRAVLEHEHQFVL